MTWLSLICSSVLLASPLVAATVSGTVRMRDSNETKVRAKMDFSGVVVWLEPASESTPAALSPQHVKMVQRDKTFTPHVLAVTSGSTVDFPNFDPIFHNAFSTYDGQIFDVGLYPPGTSRSVRFARPGIVRVFCNIHANMSAVIAVLNTRYFAVSTRKGEFMIADVPEGEYVAHFFHERATPATLRALTRKVDVNGENLHLGTIEISETGYLAIPHKNKYGRDYPAPNSTTYPSER